MQPCHILLSSIHPASSNSYLINLFYELLTREKTRKTVGVNRTRRGRLCVSEWQVGAINSSPRSDTVGRRLHLRKPLSGTMRGVSRGGVDTRAVLTSPTASIPSPSTTNTSLKFYQPAIYAKSWDAAALCGSAEDEVHSFLCGCNP